jgi:FkbM family methyltransferase
VIRTNIWKPWYVYRPQQLIRRALHALVKPAETYETLGTAWGSTLWACPAEHLGRCLSTTGVYDLAVSELLFRLTREGDLVVDAGANIGYMTLLAAVAVGPGGRVIAFEPNPDVFAILKQNVEASRHRILMAPVELRQVALGACRHAAVLVVPDVSAANSGLGYIQVDGGPREGEAARAALSIRVEPLDEVIEARPVGLLKIDVEGHEFQLLQGAVRAISARRIRHIVFEDHRGAGSEASRFLADRGYSLFSIGWSTRRVVLGDADAGRSLAMVYEAPSYLATLAPADALRAIAPPGWRALRRQTRLQPVPAC